MDSNDSLVIFVILTFMVFTSVMVVQGENVFGLPPDIPIFWSMVLVWITAMVMWSIYNIVKVKTL